MDMLSLYLDRWLDSIEKSRFGKEWLLSEGDQTIEGSMIFRDVDLMAGGVVANETVNRINLKRLFRDSVKVNESVHIKHMSVNSIKGKQIEVLGTVNGAKFEDSVLLATSPVSQRVEGDWFFDHDFIINGSLIIDGLVSGINVTRLCSQHQLEPDVISLIVGGSVTFEEEPKILGDVNGVKLEETVKEVWFKNEDATFSAGEIKFCSAELHGRPHLKGYLNDVDLENLSKNYFSKTLTKIVPGNVTVRNLVIRKSCRVRSVTVGGQVNGIDLDRWSKTVLLQDVDQVITGRYHFSEFAAENLMLNGTVNGLDLARGVLRYDVPDAVVTGGKTFIDLSVGELVLAEGKKIQEVAVGEWLRRAVRTRGNFTIRGKLTLHSPTFEQGVDVSGRVNGLMFDREHILVTSGNQTVTGKKTFDLRNYPNKTLEIKHLMAKGLVAGVDLDSLIQNQAYADENLIFTEKKSFTDVITADRLIVKGLIHNENISEICQDISQPPQLEDLTERCNKLLSAANRISKYFTEKPFFLDHYEHLQTLSDNIFAVLPFSLGADDLISVITYSEMKLMEWNSFLEQFVYKDDGVLSLVDNVTFATSGTRKSGPFLYIEISSISKIFGLGQLIQVEVDGTSCVSSFDLPSMNKSCFFIGRKWNESKIFCDSSVLNELQTFQKLQTVGTVKSSALHVGDDIYITVINKEKVVDRVENILTVYKFDKEFQSFYVSSTLPEVNPVAVATITYRHHHFLALAGGHLPESVDSSIVTIFRLNRENDVFIRYQSLLVDTPVDVHFAQLPTSELVLYVLSSNPSKPFIVYMFRGIQGFVEETSGPSLYVGAQIDSFTSKQGEHFVFISGEGRGQVLRAGFKGNKISLKT